MTLLDFLIKHQGKPKGFTWYELAIRFDIRPGGSKEQRKKSANDVWRNYLKHSLPKNPVMQEVEETMYKVPDSYAFEQGIGYINPEAEQLRQQSCNNIQDERPTAYIDGQLLDIEQYCDHYGLPFKDIHSYKLVTHSGTPFYNTFFKTATLHTEDDLDILEELDKIIAVHPVTTKEQQEGDNWGVITISDLHFGAYISAMKNTPEFSITILLDMLSYAAQKVNSKGYDIVHVHFLGDAIESFSGLNHKDSWKGLGKGMYGAKVIKLFCDTFHERFLSRINNLGSIKIVGGNHDRLASDKNEDNSGGAAELIAWGLNLMGYDTEFDPIVIKHNVGPVCNVLFHGDKSLSKLTTQTLCWMYGEKGRFNYVKEGHLHSRIQKLSVTQMKNFKLIKDDSNDCRRQVFPSFFTGNVFSEEGGWSTTPGFTIEESNGGRGVDVLDCSIDSFK